MTPLEIQRAKKAYLRTLCARIRAENEESLMHYGVKGMKWGVRKQPVRSGSNRRKKMGFQDPGDSGKIVREAISSGQVSKKINREKQMRHTISGRPPGRSYIHGGIDFAQKLVDELSGTGIALLDNKNRWLRKERVTASKIIGTYVDADGIEIETSVAMIVYSKTGTHIYPRKENDNGT